MDEQGRRECEDILAMFSTDNPLVVHPAFFKIMEDAGLRMKHVVEQKPVPMWGRNG